jgi:hypothetical protein
MYELMWNVTTFADKSTWPASGDAFVYSMNLGGSAAHGDYVFGWKGDSLQQAMDKRCNLNVDCPAAGLHASQPAEYNACTIPQAAPEPVDGCKYSYLTTTTYLVRKRNTNYLLSRAICSPRRLTSPSGIRKVLRLDGNQHINLLMTIFPSYYILHPAPKRRCTP